MGYACVVVAHSNVGFPDLKYSIVLYICNLIFTTYLKNNRFVSELLKGPVGRFFIYLYNTIE